MEFHGNISLDGQSICDVDGDWQVTHRGVFKSWSGVLTVPAGTMLKLMQNYLLKFDDGRSGEVFPTSAGAGPGLQLVAFQGTGPLE